VQALFGFESVPFTEPLTTVMAGFAPSGVAVQPLIVPLIVAIEGVPVPVNVSDGLKPIVPLLSVSHDIV
jgi:hypothetical protein